MFAQQLSYQPSDMGCRKTVAGSGQSFAVLPENPHIYAQRPELDRRNFLTSWAFWPSATSKTSSWVASSTKKSEAARAEVTWAAASTIISSKRVWVIGDSIRS